SPVSPLQLLMMFQTPKVQWENSSADPWVPHPLSTPQASSSSPRSAFNLAQLSPGGTPSPLPIARRPQFLERWTSKGRQSHMI
ncbi:hypothetical protein NPIL_86221, partial [Nephila pilipes]